MRKMLAVGTATMLLLLSTTSGALAGGGFAEGDLVSGKVSGPAVSAVIVMDPTRSSPTFGQTGMVIQKGSSYAGATFIHTVATQPAPVGWFLGCDPSLTGVRFQNVHLKAWIPADVLSGLLAAVGVQEGPHAIAAITSVNNATCTPVSADGVIEHLSFTAVIQFEDPTK
jgi:hypothetical protein